MAWPYEENESGRPCRKSPLYELLKDQGACFGEKLGWERPNWFANIKKGQVAKDEYSFERQNWFNSVGEEHRAARESAVLFDQSSFSKFAIKGPDAEAALSWIAANDVSKPVGSLTYTQMLNDRGGIECDLTVARVAFDEYYIVTGTGFATHDFNWIKRNIPATMNAQIFDVTSAYAVLSLMGPNSRKILQSVTRDDVSDEAFGFGQLKTIGIGGCPINAMRITYVGELGWELHLPVEYATQVYQKIMQAGQQHGIQNAGYRAIESLRLEKGYRAWSADIGPDHTPFESGLGWAVKLKTDIEFKGKAAIKQQVKDGVKKMLACFTIENPDVILLGRETIYRNGHRVGWLSSGGFGYTAGLPIGYGYVRCAEGVDADYIRAGEYEIEVSTQRIKATVHMKPLYDPDMKRVKC
jgi:sarcosine dehydrogenase